MFAIFKRELKAYFTSPLGYVFLAIFYAFSGLFFYIFSLSVGSTDISSVFLMMFIVLMVSCLCLLCDCFLRTRSRRRISLF